MKVFRSPICSAALLVGVLSLPQSGRSQEPVKRAEPEKSAATTPALISPDADLKLVEVNPSPLPVEFQDAGFEKYVDLSQVAFAVESGDSSLLTDLGLQLAEGERVLSRQHKSGLTSKRLLSNAARLAAGLQDKVTLERLAKAAEKHHDQELASQIATAAKLGAPSRAANPHLTVSLDSPDFDVALRIKGYLEAIKRAELLGDVELLDQVDAELKAATDIPAAQKTAVSERITAARQAMPKVTKGVIDPFQKLVGVSRGPGGGGPGGGSHGGGFGGGGSHSGGFGGGSHGGGFGGGSHSGGFGGGSHGGGFGGSSHIGGFGGGYGSHIGSGYHHHPYPNYRPYPYYRPYSTYRPYSVPVIPYSVPQYVTITLVNETDWTVGYTLNGYSKPALAPYASLTWNLQGAFTDVPSCTVSFDAGNGLIKTYTLYQGTGRFRLGDDGTIDLYQDR